MNIFFVIIGILVTLILLTVLFIYIEKSLPKLDSKGINKIDALHQWLKSLAQKGKFNGAILYIKNGNVLLEETYGYTSYTKEKRLDKNTKFRLASVSKQFTAFGIMLLKKEQALDYDELVTKYIPDFPYPETTIRHLLNQTSGISVNYYTLAKKHLNKENHILTNQNVVELLCEYPETPNVKPMQRFFYNNANYIVLARIIEIISYKSFEEYMKENVFEPLELQNTRVWNLKSETKFDDLKNTASGFKAFFNMNLFPVKPIWIDGVAGDGAVFSSINDLKKWNEVWNGNSLLSEEELSEAFKKPKLRDGTLSEYGFGWVLQEKGMWHNGKYLAANSIIIRNPERRNCFVLLDNSSNNRFEKIQKIILSTLSE